MGLLSVVLLIVSLDLILIIPVLRAEVADGLHVTLLLEYHGRPSKRVERGLASQVL